MNKQIMIALLGFCNKSSQAELYDLEELSDIAVERCKVAADLYHNNNAVILPTGSFGNHFNNSLVPHWQLLRNQLISFGVPANKILTGASSCGTTEDLYNIRYFAEENGITDIIIVTSDFHLDRVRFISYRILQDYEFSLVASKTMCCTEDELRKLEENEKCSLIELKNTWVEIPLYKKGRSFPDIIYEQSLKEHKHYDSVSLAIVSAIIVIAGFNIANSDKLFVVLIPLTFVSLVINYFLLRMYEKCSSYALVGRLIARNIEVAYKTDGYSVSEYRLRNKLKGLSLKMSIRKVVNLVLISQVILIIYCLFSIF
jgi:hypothetical protein